MIEKPEQLVSITTRKLNPNGLIIATTNCLGEIRSLRQYFHVSCLKILGFLGIIPKMTFFTRTSFRQLFEQQGYTIYEEEVLDSARSIYYLEARKN